MSSFIEARVNGLLVEWFCKEKEETARSLAERRICLGQVIYDEYMCSVGLYESSSSNNPSIEGKTTWSS